MLIHRFATALDDVLDAARVGSDARVTLRSWVQAQREFRTAPGAGHGLTDAVREKRWQDASERASAVLDATGRLDMAYQALDALQSVVERRDAVAPRATAALAQVVECLRDGVELPDSVELPPLAADFMGSDEPADDIAARAVEGLLRACDATDLDAVERRIDSSARLRLRALHARVLVSVARGGGEAIDPASLHEDRDLLASHARDIRDELRDHCRALRDGASLRDRLRLARAVAAHEARYTGDLGAKAVRLLTAARAHADAETDQRERAAREAAFGYDALREGLALLGAARVLMMAETRADSSTLAAFRRAASGRLGKATLDLARTSIAELARGEQPDGAVVEVAGMISRAAFQVGEAGNRSILRLSDAQGRHVEALVPHAAVLSFGVSPGVYAQVRGKLYPEGKDGFSGPLVLVRRVRRVAAAAESFEDFCYRRAERFLPLRPGGWDLLAGRLAGSPVATHELLYWLRASVAEEGGG